MIIETSDSPNYELTQEDFLLIDLLDKMMQFRPK